MFYDRINEKDPFAVKDGLLISNKENPVARRGLCYNRGMKTNIVYGVHAVTEALLANTGNKLYLQEDLRGKNVEKVKNWLQKEGIHFLDLKKNPSLK